MEEYSLGLSVHAAVSAWEMDSRERKRLAWPVAAPGGSGVSEALGSRDTDSPAAEPGPSETLLSAPGRWTVFIRERFCRDHEYRKASSQWSLSCGQRRGV